MVDWIGIAESAYRLDGDLDGWVAGVRDACGPMLDQGLGVSVQTFRTTGSALAIENIAVHGGPPDLAEVVRETNESASPEGVARFLGWGTAVMTMSEAVFDALPEVQDSFMESSGAFARDVLGVVVRCGVERGVAISIPIPHMRKATRKGGSRVRGPNGSGAVDQGVAFETARAISPHRASVAGSRL